MDEQNKQFNDTDLNQETNLPTEPIEVEEVQQPEITGEVVNHSQTQDAEIDLDPDIVLVASQEQNSNHTPETESANEYANADFSAERFVEPTPPIMPYITKNEYQPMSTRGKSRGMRVFAVIVALMVVLSAAVTGGYFLGASKNGSPNVKVDLAKKPSEENALTVSQVYASANKSVVGIYTYNDEGIAGTSSGVVYSKEGYIVTNDHIYADVEAAKFKVYTYDGKSFSAKYVAGDTRSDLAVLKIDNPSGLVPATFGNSAEVTVGEMVVAVGRPNGADQASTASEGIVSSISRRVSTTSSYSCNFIQTSSAINPGSSGGALYNIYGQAIGITSAKLVGDAYEGVGFAIPTLTMKKVVDSLIKNGEVKGRARLGIMYQEVNELAAEVSGMPSGLLIASIDKDSALYGKSVGANDIITHVNGNEIKNSNIVLDTIENSKAGDTLNLKVYLSKQKKSVDISVKLLEDKGSSSYLKKASGNNNDNSSSSKQEYNSSAFTFPYGE